MRVRQKSSQSCNDFIDELSTQDSQIKCPKCNKAKFMKQLNHKAFSNLNSSNKSQISQEKSKQFLIQRVRSRGNINFQQNDHIKQENSPKVKILNGDDKIPNLNGQVVIQYGNGNKFEGRYQFGLRIHGKLIFQNARCEYNGGFIGEKFSGRGKLTYYNGREIEGEWDDTSIVGNATIKYPNHDIYYGKVDQKLYKHGEGYLFLNNGAKYVGQFKKGGITGIGSYYNSKGELQAKGFWKKGKLIKDLENIQEGEEQWSTLQRTLQLPQSLLLTLNELNMTRISTLLSEIKQDQDQVITGFYD